MNQKYLFVFLIFLGIITLLAAGCAKGPGKYDTFAKCLSEKGAKMFGTEWCPHCKNQKEQFGNSIQYIDYIDCDWNKDECLKYGIRGYPTWVIDREKYSGEQRLEKLSELTGCEL